MAKQIAAGLGASISGLPYWTMDTGGYTMQNKFSKQPMTPDNQDEWRELNARWFQYSTFTPLLRVHGELRPREMWTSATTPPPSTPNSASTDCATLSSPISTRWPAGATQSDYTMMRPLVMDFPADRIARELPDEYMFGPALLVAPVTQYKQRTRSVYLPASAQWYDYWTGRPAASGRISAAAPLDRIPVFVRAGSIIPYAPPMQYIGEKPSDPTTLYRLRRGQRQLRSSTRTREPPSTTKTGPSRKFPSAGTTSQAPSLWANAPAASTACSTSAPSRSCWSPPRTQPPSRPRHPQPSPRSTPEPNSA